MNQLLQKLRDDPRIGYSVVAVVLLIAAANAYFALQPPDLARRDISRLNYLDLNTKERFSAPWGDGNEVPPLDAPSGPLTADAGPLKKGEPAGVRALVFACGVCSNEQFVGWLETNTVEGRKKSLDKTLMPEDLPKVWYIRKPEDGSPWHLRASPEGGAIMSAIFNGKCPAGQTVQPCEANE